MEIFPVVVSTRVATNVSAALAGERWKGERWLVPRGTRVEQG
jgi:hypothetical protein